MEVIVRENEFVTFLDCEHIQRERDQKLVGAVDMARKNTEREAKQICEQFDTAASELKEEIKELNKRLDNLLLAGVGLVVTSLISVCLSLFTIVMQYKP